MHMHVRPLSCHPPASDWRGGAAERDPQGVPAGGAAARLLLQLLGGQVRVRMRSFDSTYPDVRTRLMSFWTDQRPPTHPFHSLQRSIPEWGEGVKLIYRHYATLYFVFAVDQQESDLGILDLIQGTERRICLLGQGCRVVLFTRSVCSRSRANDAAVLSHPPPNSLRGGIGQVLRERLRARPHLPQRQGKASPSSVVGRLGPSPLTLTPTARTNQP